MASNGIGSGKKTPNHGQSGFGLTKIIKVVNPNKISNLGFRYLSETQSDISFVIENEVLPSHLWILKARCEYFRYFYNNTNGPIPIRGRLDVFKEFLRYVYTGDLSLRGDAVLHVLVFAKLFGLPDLVSELSKSVRGQLTLDNVCKILNESMGSKLRELAYFCLKFMSDNAPEVLKHESYKTLSKASLEDLKYVVGFGIEKTVSEANKSELIKKDEN